MRTEEQKKHAVIKLTERRDGMPEMSFFGDNNHDAFDAAINVINTNVLSEDSIYSKHYETHTENMAIAACQWMNEEIGLDDLIE